MQGNLQKCGGCSACPACHWRARHPSRLGIFAYVARPCCSAMLILSGAIVTITSWWAKSIFGPTRTVFSDLAAPQPGGRSTLFLLLDPGAVCSAQALGAGAETRSVDRRATRGASAARLALS